MKSKDDRLTEAYELILEECQLQSYLRLHPCISDREVEQNPAGELFTEFEGQNGEESTQQSSSTSIDDIYSIQRDLEDEESCNSEGWTEEELSAFFISLSRRSRFFPDLISKDLNNVKSTSQIAHLISLMRQESIRRESERKGEEIEATITSKTRTARNIKLTKGAHEVSDEWIAFEERMAAKLRDWETGEDANGMYDSMSPIPSREDPATELDKEQDVIQEINMVSWDSQIMNAMLFLRHHQDTSPDLNPPNCSFELHLDPSRGQGGSSKKIFYFHASTITSLLDEEIRQSSYYRFAKYNPVPLIRTRGAAKPQMETYKDSLVTKIILRGIELGLLSRISLIVLNGIEMPQAILIDRGGVGGNLIWLDTLTPMEISSRAINALQKSREAAAKRLMNTLRWKEFHAIDVALRKSKDEMERERIQEMMLQHDSAEMPSIERNRILSRLRARVKRFGLEAAMEMSLEATPRGEKRSHADDEDNQQSSKRIRLDRELSRERDEVRIGEDEGVSSEGKKCIDTSDTLVRFKQIGATFELIERLLPRSVREGLDLLNVSAMKRLTILEATHQDVIDPHSPADGLSQRSFSLLTSLLHNYIIKVISTSIQLASLGQSEEIKEVRLDHVRLAIRNTSAAAASQSPYFASESRLDSALHEFRSDPPRLYEHHSFQAQSNIDLHLQGLKNISMNRTLFDSYNSTSKDGVITFSDGFTFPISSQFGPQMRAMFINKVGDNQFESDSDESSIIDNSDQEVETQMRRDEKKGVDRKIKIDGRIWDHNEKRDEMESKRWAKLERYDAKVANRHERRLWASVGILKKRQEDNLTLRADRLAEKEIIQEDGHISLSSDESEIGGSDQDTTNDDEDEIADDEGEDIDTGYISTN